MSSHEDLGRVPSGVGDDETVIGQCNGIPGKVVLVQNTKRRQPQLLAVKKYFLDMNQQQYSQQPDMMSDSLNSASGQSGKAEEFSEQADHILREVVRMRQLLHPNILHCLHSYVTGPTVCVVMPFMSLGSVRSAMEAVSGWEQGLPEVACAKVLGDVTQALAYLHSKSVIHRSVRCSHILLTQATTSQQVSSKEELSLGGSFSFVAKLSGLRYACSLHDPPGQGLQDRYDYPLHVAKTNLNWLSPEFLQQNLMGYNERSDLYSLGVAACEMANGLVPFSEMPATMMLIEKLRGASPKLLDCSTFALDDESAIRAIAPQQPHQQMKQSNFATNQPGDSGVGVSSVGGSSSAFPTQAIKEMSESTLEALHSKASVFASRNFSESFHEFVDLCSLDALERPTAQELLTHPFLSKGNQNKKLLAAVHQDLLRYQQRTMEAVKKSSQTLRPSVASANNSGSDIARTLSGLDLNSGGPEWDF